MDVLTIKLFPFTIVVIFVKEIAAVKKKHALKHILQLVWINSIVQTNILWNV